MSILAGRTALITGGSRGIGAATARRLAALGADIAVTYQSNSDAASAVVNECRDVHRVRAAALRLDLSESFKAEDLIPPFADTVDIVVVNAAAQYPKVPLRDLPVDALAAKITADISCVHRLVAHFGPTMLQRGYGRVVVVGSMHAIGPFAPGMTANGTSKAAMEAYVDYAVDELTGPGVTVNTVRPGYIATDLSQSLPPAIPALLEHLTPSRRDGAADDVAAVVAMLADPGMDFLNGARIPVAGGLNQAISLRRVLGAAG